jgi:polyhydroxyalkanoate synthesis regulator phasin
VSTGILSDGERAFFEDEKEVEDPDGYQRNARYRARQRMDQIEEDLEVLREAGQEDLVEEFVNRFGRVERLEREVEELREKLDEDAE